MRYLCVIFILLTLCGCSVPEKRADADGKKIRIAASIIPFADFAKQIGGDLVTIETIVPPGANPHVFEPSPGQLASFSKADIFICAGAGFEFWKDKFIESSGNKNLTVVELSNGIKLLDGEECGEDCTCHSHKSGNPHIWTSPALVLTLIPKIEKALCERDPQNAESYKKNSALFIDKLKKLDEKCRKTTASFKVKKFLSQHAVWPYFAKEYGMIQVGTIETTPGREPSPADIEMLIKCAKEHEVSVIFADSQFSPKAAAAVAEDGKLKVVILDAVGENESSTYIEMIEKNLNKMKEAMT